MSSGGSEQGWAGLVGSREEGVGDGVDRAGSGYRRGEGGSGVEDGSASGVDRLSDGSIDGVDSDGEYEFSFFRFKNRLVFDSSDEETLEDLQQNDIDYMLGVPEMWEDREIKKCIYSVFHWIRPVSLSILK